MLRGRVGKNLRGSGRGQDTAVEGHALIMSALSPPFEGPHKPESRTTVGSSSSAPGYISKHMKAQTRKNTCAPVFTPALSTAAKLAVTEVSVDRRAGKEGVVWMCSGILLSHKKGMRSCRLRQHGWTWRVMLSGLSQTKTTYFSLTGATLRTINITYIRKLKR